MSTEQYDEGLTACHGRTEPGPIPLSQASAGLHAALDRASPGPTGMRSVRAIGPDGERYAAGLHGQEILILRLPWPNPDEIAERLGAEPLNVEWHPHQL
jgi:hypothetical protein